MHDLTTATLLPPDTTRLRALLQHDTAGPSDAAIAEAISVGPDAAGELAASLIDTTCRTGLGRPAAVRSAWLARGLRLEQAVPALIRCLERLPAGHPLLDASMTVLAQIGPAAIDPLVAALERADLPGQRYRFADTLALSEVDDERIRAALVRTLDDEPEHGASLLANRGEWRAIPDLLRTFDRLAREPIADCVLCEGMQLTAIANAIAQLGGELSAAQVAALDDVLERGEPMWTPGPDALEGCTVPLPPRRRAARPGRNDPCPCGSGKKYKRCHLEEDRRNATQ